MYFKKESNGNFENEKLQKFSSIKKKISDTYRTWWINVI